MALIKSPGGILVPTTTAWDFDQTAGEWLDADANFFTGKPFTVGVIEYRRQANGTNLWSVAGEFSVFNTSDLYYFWIDGHTITVSAPVDTRWHSIVCREVANNDHRIRVSGTEATSTTNKPLADPLAGAISVGNFNGGAGTRIDAIVARVAFWDTTLTDAEVALFEAGVPPGEIRPGKLLSWLEFDSPHLDRIERIPGVTWSWNSGTHEPFIASTNPISRKRLDPILFYKAAASGFTADLTSATLAVLVANALDHTDPFLAALSTATMQPLVEQALDYNAAYNVDLSAATLQPLVAQNLDYLVGFTAELTSATMQALVPQAMDYTAKFLAELTAATAAPLVAQSLDIVEGFEADLTAAALQQLSPQSLDYIAKFLAELTVATVQPLNAQFLDVTDGVVEEVTTVVRRALYRVMNRNR